MPVRSVGVEEEFLLVDPESGAPRAVASTVLRAGDDLDGDLTNELHAEQLETGTSPRTGLDEIGREIVTAAAKPPPRPASGRGCRAAGHLPAAGRPARQRRPPLPRDDAPLRPHRGRAAHLRLPRPRRGRVGRRSRRRGRPHPAVAARAAGAHRQLPVLGRARQRVRQLPQPGVGSLAVGRADGPFGSAAEYHRFTEQLLRTETVLDRGMLYFDARPSHHHPTVEVRVADVCRDPRDTLLLAALTRGLVETAAREWAAGPAARPRPARGAAPRRVAGRAVGDRRRPAPAPRLAPGYRPTTSWTR